MSHALMQFAVKLSKTLSKNHRWSDKKTLSLADPKEIATRQGSDAISLADSSKAPSEDNISPVLEFDSVSIADSSKAPEKCGVKLIWHSNHDTFETVSLSDSSKSPE